MDTEAAGLGFENPSAIEFVSFSILADNHDILLLYCLSILSMRLYLIAAEAFLCKQGLSYIKHNPLKNFCRIFRSKVLRHLL